MPSARDEPGSGGWVENYSSSVGQPDYYGGLSPEGEPEPGVKAVPSQQWRAVDSGTRTKRNPIFVNIFVISFLSRCWKYSSLLFISSPTNCFWLSTVVSQRQATEMWTCTAMLSWEVRTERFYKSWKYRNETRPPDKVRPRSFLFPLFSYVGCHGSRSGSYNEDTEENSGLMTFINVPWNLSLDEFVVASNCNQLNNNQLYNTWYCIVQCSLSITTQDSQAPPINRGWSHIAQVP